jgi:hypothetical protein
VNNILASSSIPATPVIESIRPGGVISREQVSNLCVQISPKLVMIASTTFMGLAQKAMDEKAAGKPANDLATRTELAAVMSKLLAKALFEELEPLLVGRLKIDGAKKPTEANS